jgi:hypothetical protein
MPSPVVTSTCAKKTTPKVDLMDLSVGRNGSQWRYWDHGEKWASIEEANTINMALGTKCGNCDNEVAENDSAVSCDR